MAKNTTIKFAALICLLFTGAASFAQAKYDGNSFGSFLGKSPESSEVAELVNNYSLQMANNAHYTSKDGVELIIKDDILAEIHLYSNSAVYGSFKRNLPKGLNFGMSSLQAKKLLGKPTLTYMSSGYSEFDVDNYTLTCWFEGDKLTQVGVVAKASE